MGHRGQLWGQGGISVFVALLEIQSPEESRPVRDASRASEGLYRVGL